MRENNIADKYSERVQSKQRNPTEALNRLRSMSLLRSVESRKAKEVDAPARQDQQQPTPPATGLHTILCRSTPSRRRSPDGRETTQRLTRPNARAHNRPEATLGAGSRLVVHTNTKTSTSTVARRGYTPRCVSGYSIATSLLSCVCVCVRECACVCSEIDASETVIEALVVGRWGIFAVELVSASLCTARLLTRSRTHSVQQFKLHYSSMLTALSFKETQLVSLASSSCPRT
jgi:hypothetical protein